MANDPKEPVDEKVGAYDKDTPERSGGMGPIIWIVLIVLAVLLLLWLFTDIL